MKNRPFHTGFAILIAMAAVHFAQAEDKPAVPAMDPKMMEEIMKKAEALHTPAAAHKTLEPLIGEWNAEVKMWMAPDAPPMVTKAAAKSAWAMKGRFVQEDFDGEMMGKPYHGMSLIGHDNFKQKYNMAWVDDTNTSLFTCEGSTEDGGKVITFTGKMDCPMTGEKDMPVKYVLRLLDKDKHVLEMHDPRKGEKSMNMQITYTRK